MRVLGFSLVSISLIFSVSGIADSSSAINSKYRPAPQKSGIENQYIVILKESYMNEDMHSELTVSNKKKHRKQKIASVSLEMAKKYQGHIRHQYSSGLSGFSITMDAKHLEAMLADERIDYIEQDEIIEVDTIQKNAIWGLDRIDQADLPLNSEYNYQYTGAGVTAYIIDTGTVALYLEKNPMLTGTILKKILKLTQPWIRFLMLKAHRTYYYKRYF